MVPGLPDTKLWPLLAGLFAAIPPAAQPDAASAGTASQHGDAARHGPAGVARNRGAEGTRDTEISYSE